jgi:hypothetical protein
LRDRQAEGFGGRQIDDQLKPRRLMNWQIGRLGAFEDLSGVNADLLGLSVGHCGLRRLHHRLDDELTIQ